MWMENLDKRRMVVLLFLKLITSDNPIKSVLAAADRFEKIFFFFGGVQVCVRFTVVLCF